MLWTTTYLFQCLVVDKTGGILWHLELALLDLLAKLPIHTAGLANGTGATRARF
jgi:hypothetical protein